MNGNGWTDVQCSVLLHSDGTPLVKVNIKALKLPFVPVEDYGCSPVCLHDAF